MEGPAQRSRRNREYTNEQVSLRLYYERLFPHNLLYRWLSYGEASYFFRREIAFVLSNSQYLRHFSYETEEEFVQHLLQRLPYKIEIGCVFDIPPRDHIVASALVPLEKELVFDIDMTDYDELRTCCKGTNVCGDCWKFLSIACQILQDILEDDFGFVQILWVFSGRRGVHCWVCDSAARTLTNEERQSILSYINLVQGNANVSRRVKLPRPIHSSIRRALDTINQNFIDFIIVEQDVLRDDKLEYFFSLLWDLPRDDYKGILRKCNGSLERWNAFVSYLEEHDAKNSLPDKLKYLKEEIILHFTYPRLDAAVTSRMDHLLKAPFCVHPQTQKVCVPFDPRKAEEFDVGAVPTVDALLDELNEYCRLLFEQKVVESEDDDELDRKIKALMSTSLSSSYKVFLDFIKKLEKS